MSKVKLIHSNFDPETGISTATIRTDMGDFTGTSKLHEEDRSISSNYAGCQYAEMRAVIKYMRKRVEVVTNQIKGLENYQKVIKGKVSYNHNSMESRTLRKHIYILKKEKANWQSKIYSLSNKLYTMMMIRDKIVENIVNGNKRGE